MEWATHSVELMWAAGLAVVPVALLVALCTRWKGTRPATRHMLWLGAMATFLSPIAVGVWRPTWFTSEKMIAAADSMSRSGDSGHFNRALVNVDVPHELQTSPIGTTSSLVGLTTSAMEHRRAPAAPASKAMMPLLGSAPTEPAKFELPAKSQGVRQPAPVARRVASAAPIMQWKPQLEAVPTKDPLAESTYSSKANESSHRPIASWSGQVRDWLIHLIAVRDALAAVPAIPAGVWLGGSLILLVLWLTRLLVVSRVIRRGERAPEPVCAMVRRLSKIAGVRPPRTIMVDDRVSPMIWCGMRPRLVIPRELWRQLDSRCQSAVIVHELAHLKRRDHRMCWLNGLVGIAYWWHPVSWWVRRRLRDEAEACCDAWVTTLLPGGRRAYAEALITTKSFLSVPGRSGAPGLGVVSTRTRQLARRVTMVMTQRVAPRSSVFGLAIALAIAGAGIFVMPGLACPPEEGKSEAKKVQGVMKAEKARNVQGEAFLGEAPALEAMLRRGQPPSDWAGGAEMQERMKVLRDKEASLREMEARLRQMEQRLRSMERSSQGGAFGGRAGAAGAGQARAGSAPAAPMPPRAPVAVVAPTAPSIRTPGALAPRAAQSRSIAPGALGSIGVAGQATAPQAVVVAGDTVPRSYKLPGGKLEALVNLMARQDVPIYISSDNDEITVNATPAQHEVFAAFVKMIHPEGHSSATPSHNPLTTTVQGHALTTQNMAMEAQRKALRESAEQLRKSAADMQRRKVDSQRQGELYRRQVERLRDNAERLREKSENRRDEVEAEGAEAADLSRAVKEAESATQELDKMDVELDQLDEMSCVLDCQIEEIQAAIEALTSQADELNGEDLPAVEVVGVPLTDVVASPAIITVPGMPAPAAVPQLGSAPSPTSAPAAEAAPATAPAAPR